MLIIRVTIFDSSYVPLATNGYQIKRMYSFLVLFSA